jgi:hypothetical protein
VAAYFWRQAEKDDHNHREDSPKHYNPEPFSASRRPITQMRCVMMHVRDHPQEIAQYEVYVHPNTSYSIAMRSQPSR